MDPSIAVGGAIMVPLIVGLVEVAKRSGMPIRFAPALSVILGVVLSVAATFTQSVDGKDVIPRDPVVAVLIGLALGLSASGLYSGTRTTIKSDEKTR